MVVRVVSHLLTEILDYHEQPDVAKVDDKQNENKIPGKGLGKGKDR